LGKKGTQDVKKEKMEDKLKLASTSARNIIHFVTEGQEVLRRKGLTGKKENSKKYQ